MENSLKCPLIIFKIANTLLYNESIKPNKTFIYIHTYTLTHVLQTHRSSTPIHTTFHSFQHNKVFFLPRSSTFINMLHSILPKKISTQRVAGNCWTSRCNINISTVPKVTIKGTTMYQLQRNKVLHQQQ